MGTFIFFSQKMEGKSNRDTGHGKLEQCVLRFFKALMAIEWEKEIHFLKLY